jgi:hypothetical protein
VITTDGTDSSHASPLCVAGGFRAAFLKMTTK